MPGTKYDTGKKFITFLLVGKTGDGKSATCNSLIGSRKCESKQGFTSTTKKCQKEVARIQGHNVAVVDSPGLADTDITTDGGLEQFKKEVIDIFTTEPDGFDVVIIIIRYGRKFTAEDRRVFQELNLLFGEEYVKERAVLLVTHKDKYHPETNGNVPIHVLMKAQTGLFQEMLNQCNNRVLYFDNDTKDESIRHAQVKQLLDMSDKLRQSPLRVTPEIMVRVQEAEDYANKETKNPVIDKNTLINLWILIFNLEEIPVDCRDIQRFQKFAQIMENFQEQLLEQDSGTDSLTDVMVSTSCLQGAIRLRIAAIENDRHVREAAEDMSQKIQALEMLLREIAKALTASSKAVIETVLNGYIDRVFAPQHEQEKAQSCVLQ